MIASNREPSDTGEQYHERRLWKNRDPTQSIRHIKTKKNSEVGSKEGVEEMADEDPDSELWGEMNTDLESFLTEFVASKKWPISDDNILSIHFKEVFGREDSAKGKILWDFIKRKTNQQLACNISFPSRPRGYEDTVIQLTLSGEIRSKIPEKYYHVRTSRSSAYKVEHEDRTVAKFVTPLVDTMVTEINSKAGDNENLKEKIYDQTVASISISSYVNHLSSSSSDKSHRWQLRRWFWASSSFSTLLKSQSQR